VHAVSDSQLTVVVPKYPNLITLDTVTISFQEDPQNNKYGIQGI